MDGHWVAPPQTWLSDVPTLVSGPASSPEASRSLQKNLSWDGQQRDATPVLQITSLGTQTFGPGFGGDVLVPDIPEQVSGDLD